MVEEEEEEKIDDEEEELARKLIFRIIDTRSNEKRDKTKTRQK